MLHLFFPESLLISELSQKYDFFVCLFKWLGTHLGEIFSSTTGVLVTTLPAIENAELQSVWFQYA